MLDQSPVGPGFLSGHMLPGERTSQADFARMSAECQRYRNESDQDYRQKRRGNDAKELADQRAQGCVHGGTSCVL